VSYALESAALDGEILHAIATWHRGGRALDDAEFDDLALRLFAYQLRYNAPYARFCASFGISERALPQTWQDIPAVPTQAYKEATLTTFDPAHALIAFTTSGTTARIGGRHYMETRTLYDASLLAAFDHFILPDRAHLRYLNFVPNPGDRPESSLGYMMARVSADRGDEQTGWYLRGDEVFVDAFIADANAAIKDNAAVCIAGTAFAFVQLCDALAGRKVRFVFPAGSRVMETGGFKGRSRVVKRDDLYAGIGATLGISQDQIVAEYGMTELSSQWYDRAAGAAEHRVKASPPWLRARIVGANGTALPRGVVGAIVHVDLANRSSCLAVQTEDLGADVDGGIVLFGREQGAALRGCSLDAESLRPR
jgi:hypothetical protein